MVVAQRYAKYFLNTEYTDERIITDLWPLRALLDDAENKNRIFLIFAENMYSVCFLTQ
jgi:hypothetical protein